MQTFCQVLILLFFVVCVLFDVVATIKADKLDDRIANAIGRPFVEVLCFAVAWGAGAFDRLF